MTVMTPAARSARRAAFTLIELLTVIAIIAVLASLLVAVLVAVFGTSNRNNSVGLVKKAGTMLAPQWKAATDNARDEAKSGQALQTILAQVTPINPALRAYPENHPDLVRTLWINLRLQQEFPTTFAEARSGASASYLDPTVGASPGTTVTVNLGPKNSYVKYLLGQPGGAQPLEGSACLVMALSESRRGEKANLEDGAGQYLRAAGGSGPKVLVDLWGIPIMIERTTVKQGGLTTYEWGIRCAGPDKVINTSDDIVTQDERKGQ